MGLEPKVVFGRPRGAALAADCASVVKPSSKTPLSMIALFALIDQLGLPAGKANLVMGSADEIGDVLCTHPLVRVVSFTGSTNVGKHLMTMAAPHLKRLSLELVGNAPFIVFEDAGQACVRANRLYVHRKIAEDFARGARCLVGGPKSISAEQKAVGSYSPPPDRSGWRHGFDDLRECRNVWSACANYRI